MEYRFVAGSHQRYIINDVGEVFSCLKPEKRSYKRICGITGKLKGWTQSGYRVCHLTLPNKTGEWKGCTKRIHVLMWETFRGVKPKNHVLDHVNGDKQDNRLENLRLASQMQNTHNVPPRTHRYGILLTSMYKGVCKCKGRRKWESSIRVNKKLIRLGSFEDEQDAAKAYDAAARKYFGQYARCNFND